ncbi:hypothetical protein JHK87_019633 [Glycine soja]|nr:hypothetical protein JHK87_019633 [Glycine soja]
MAGKSKKKIETRVPKHPTHSILKSKRKLRNPSFVSVPEEKEKEKAESDDTRETTRWRCATRDPPGSGGGNRAHSALLPWGSGPGHNAGIIGPAKPIRPTPSAHPSPSHHSVPLLRSGLLRLRPLLHRRTRHHPPPQRLPRRRRTLPHPHSLPLVQPPPLHLRRRQFR